jgi:N-acetylneuraminic acid mutarotase
MMFLMLIMITACSEDSTSDSPPSESSKELPVASFTVSKEIARIGDTIYFQNTSENANSIEWDFGDGHSSIEENPSHFYTANDSYNVTLKVSNNDGSDESRKKIQITFWEPRAPMISARWWFTVSTMNGKIYAIGGGSKYGHGALKEVEEYDPETDTWSLKSDMPTARQGLTCSVVNGKIYAIGGGEAPNEENYDDFESLSTVEEYDPATDTWKKKTSMPTARAAHGAAVVDGKIYIIGGASGWPFGDTYIFNIEVYDPAIDTWTSGGDIPRKMVGSACAVVNDKIYVIGGDLGDALEYRVDEYDPVIKKWSQKANAPSPRQDLNCAVLENRIYIIGGDHKDNYFYVEVDVYDPESDFWTTTTPMIRPRVGPGTCTLESEIYVLGGLPQWKSPACNNVEVYIKD